MQNKVKRIVRNEYVYSVITKVITILIGMAQTVLISRYLGADLKGVNAYIHSIAVVGSIIITFGMHEAYPYFRKKYGKDAVYQDYASLIMILYAGFLAAGILLAVFIPVSIEIRAVFVLIPLLGYSRIVSYVVLIENPNRRNTWWTIISVLDILYVVFLWIFIRRSVFWGITILVFADLLKSVVFTLQLKVRPVISRKLLPLLSELIRYGFFPMIAMLMTVLNYRIDTIMLHQYHHITDGMIGIYSLGISLSDKIVLIPDTLKGVLASRLAKGAENEEVAKAARLGLWASLAVCAVVAVLGQPVLSLLFGAEYDGAYSVVLITAAGVLAVVCFKMIAQYNIVHKKQRVNVLLLSIAVIVDVILNLAFIPRWGINGAAMATSIGNIACGIAFLVYFRRETGIPLSRMLWIQSADLRMIRNLLHRRPEKAKPDQTDGE